LSLFGSNNELILLHKNMPKPKKAKVYDIVLTPEFYITKRVDLPIKYEYQAKKVAPSVLEELLPNENSYEYVVFKDSKYWNFYAYNPKEIEDFLEEYGIKPHQIGKIYFADQLFDVLKKVPISLDENSALTLVDGYATIVPKKMLESSGFLKFAKRFRPKKGVWFKRSSKGGKKADKIDKLPIALAIAIFLLGILYIIEGFSYKRALNKELDKLSAITINHPQLQSKITRDSIKSKYLKIEKEQRAIRELIDIFSQLSSKKSILNNLKLDGKKIEATYKVDKSEVKRFKAIAADSKLKIVNQNADTITVQGVLK